MTFGGVTLWNFNIPDASYPYMGESADAQLTFELTKINRSYWRSRMWGTENNSWGVTNTYTTYNAQTSVFQTTSDVLRFDVSGSSCANCAGTTMYLYVDYVNVSRWTRENSTVYSNSIYDSSSDIDKINGIWFSGQVPDPKDENVTVYLSADDGINWEAVTTLYSNGGTAQVTDYYIGNHTFSNTGRNLRFAAQFIFATENPNSTSQLWKMNISMPSGSPKNISLDFGNDGIIDYNLTSGTLSDMQQADLSNVNISSSFIEDNRYVTLPHTYLIPLSITSRERGTMQISNINITYNPNPVILNYSRIQSILDNSTNFTTFRIPFSASNSTALAATINLTGLRYDYIGGNKSYIFTVHSLTLTNNITNSLTYYASTFNRALSYSWTDYIFFLPKTNSSKNVSAYGQTTTIPLMSINTTNYGGRNMNLSLNVNQTYSCLTLSWNNISTKPSSGNIVNTTFQQIAGGLGYLNKKNLWLWADLNNCNASENSMLSPNLNIKSYCEGCLWS